MATTTSVYEMDGFGVPVVNNVVNNAAKQISQLKGIAQANSAFNAEQAQLQREWSERQSAKAMQVGPGTKDYGALSLAVQYYARPEIMLNVPPTCFMPRPNVGSAVIRLTRFEEPPVKAQDERKMFSIIRAAFNQRRKTLANALTNGLAYTNEEGRVIHVSRKEVCETLEKMGLSQTIRGEALSLEQFARLSDLL